MVLPPAGDRVSTRRSRTVLHWAALFFFCAALWAAETVVQSSQRRAAAEQLQREAQVDAIADCIAPHSYFMVTRRQVETNLGGGPLLRLSGLGDLTPRYQWDASVLGPQYTDWKLVLRFRGFNTGDAIVEQLIAFQVLAPPPRLNGSSTLPIEMERTRRFVLLLGGTAWLLGVATLVCARPWRGQLAQVCCAGVVMAAVAWSVDPTRVWQHKEVVAPLPITIAFAGSVSLIMLLYPRRRRKGLAASPMCHGCGYNLTGNLSGICPECGRPTPRHYVERWRDQADRISQVEVREPQDTTDLLADTGESLANSIVHIREIETPTPTADANAPAVGS